MGSPPNLEPDCHGEVLDFQGREHLDANRRALRCTAGDNQSQVFTILTHRCLPQKPQGVRATQKEMRIPKMVRRWFKQFENIFDHRFCNI